MIGSEKQINWALSIQNKVLWTIANNPDKFPLSEEMVQFYQDIQDASWWINTRQKLAMPEYILVYGLVSLVQYKGLPEACDEVIRLQDDDCLASIFDEFKVEVEEC
jgi:hypothetical protein